MLRQRLHISITKLLSHLKIIEDLDSDYEKQQFFSPETHLILAFKSIYLTKSTREKQ